MHSKPALEEFGPPRITPEACKAASARAKKLTFVFHSTRPQRSRWSRKPLLLQTRRLRLPPVDATIRVFFREPCRSSKQWLRSFFAITLCGKTRLACPPISRVEALER